MSEKARDINETAELNSDVNTAFENSEYEQTDEKSPVAEAVNTAAKRPLVSTSLKLLLIGLLVASILIFIASFIRYSELQNQKRALAEQINETEENIEETEYLLDIPLTDKDYIIRIAKEKLGLFLPDEIVYYSDLND